MKNKTPFAIKAISSIMEHFKPIENLKSCFINSYVGTTHINDVIRMNIDALESARQKLISDGKWSVLIGFRGGYLGFFYQHNKHDVESYENFNIVCEIKIIEDIYSDYDRDEDGNLISCCGDILNPDVMICPTCKEHN